MSWCRSSFGGRTSVKELQLTSEYGLLQSTLDRGQAICINTLLIQDKILGSGSSPKIYLANTSLNALLAKLLCLWLHLALRLPICNPHSKRWGSSKIVSSNHLVLPLFTLTTEAVSQLHSFLFHVRQQPPTYPSLCLCCHHPSHHFRLRKLSQCRCQIERKVLTKWKKKNVE